MVCTICWEKKEIRMIDGIISAYKNNPSNCREHIRTHHKNAKEVPGLYSDVSTITNTNSIVSSKSKATNKQETLHHFQPSPADLPTPQIALSLLYMFFNEANIAICQANNVHLSNFITYLLEHAHLLRARRLECLFSRYKYIIQRDDRFLKYVSSMKELVDYSRKYYLTKFNKCVPFIYVSHDGWDSIDHDVLGVCVHFIIPGYYRVVNLAAGLKRIKSKKSIATAQAIFIILERYDLFMCCQLNLLLLILTY